MVVGVFLEIGEYVVRRLSAYNYERALHVGVCARRGKNGRGVSAASSSRFLSGLAGGITDRRGAPDQPELLISMVGLVPVFVAGPVRNGDLIYLDNNLCRPGLATACPGKRQRVVAPLLLGQILHPAPLPTGSAPDVVHRVLCLVSTAHLAPRAPAGSERVILAGCLHAQLRGLLSIFRSSNDVDDTMPPPATPLHPTNKADAPSVADALSALLSLQAGPAAAPGTVGAPAPAPVPDMSMALASLPPSSWRLAPELHHGDVVSLFEVTSRTLVNIDSFGARVLVPGSSAALSVATQGLTTASQPGAALCAAMAGRSAYPCGPGALFIVHDVHPSTGIYALQSVLNPALALQLGPAGLHGARAFGHHSAHLQLTAGKIPGTMWLAVAPLGSAAPPLLVALFRQATPDPDGALME
jgi:hypothetical protein